MDQQRLRITFAKRARLKYISHLDLALAWERALRRAVIPLAYSQGHNPQARLQLASGLPLGYTGSAEVMDAILNEPIPLQEFSQRVRPVLPDGLTLVGVEEVDVKSPALQPALRQAVYRVTVETALTGEELARRIGHLLAAGQLTQQRMRKQRVETFDLRPLLHGLWLEAVEEGRAVLGMRLSAGQQGNARPNAVLAALGLEDVYAQVERTQLLFEFDNK